MSLAYLPGQEGIDLRLTIRGVGGDEADARLAAGGALLAERVGRYVYGAGDTDLASVVLDACRVRGWRIAVAESCTGGLLGGRLSAIPGASDVFLGGIIAYDNAVKREQLGVASETLEAQGAVSEAVARDMASGVRARLGSQVGIGITGIAGPGGGTPEKPVGLVWIAVDVDGSVRTFGGRLVGDRAEVRYRATQAALDMVRRTMSP
jgi:nicotinamide-nucleotide amidase